jgi:nucleotide-binding universal stress UspA family protein
MKIEPLRILVPLDGSPAAEAAFAAAAPLFRQHEVELLLLNVLDGIDGPVGMSSYLAKTCDDFRSRGIKAAFNVRYGKPAEEILHYAADKQADLIVMSTHGRTGVGRVFMGSVTEEVMRHAPVPLIVCRPGTAAPDWKRIVVALDGSERAEGVLSDVGSLARTLKARVDLVKAAMPALTPAGMGEIGMYLPAEDVMPYLRGVCDRLCREGVDARPIPLSGRAAAEVVRHAAEIGAGLVCMTTHGRTGLPRVLLGSIAEEVLRTAPCPVLVRRGAAKTAAACIPE